MLVSYASGQRPADEEGTGPGFVQAFQFIKLLKLNGHMCFSGLHVPVDNNRKIFFRRLDGKKAKAKVFIALLNHAYFGSMPCMNELHRAITIKVKILLVRMEDNIPLKQDQWKKITAETDKAKRLEVQEFLASQNTIPHTGTLLTVPSGFTEILKIIREHCKCDARHSSSEQVAKSVEVKVRETTSSYA